MFRHILVPTDGSALSLRAVKMALGLARGQRTRVTAFHVIAPFVPSPYMDGMAVYPELFSASDYKRVAEAGAKRMLDRVARRAATSRVRCATAFVTADAPWRAIIRAARSKRCDVIVMSSHGRTGLGAVVLGSVTTKVLTHTRIPVLVCR